MVAPIITLLTDFGLADPYVGVMKGVILGIANDARIVDLGHDVGAQNIREGNFALRGAWTYFPAGTIHVAVVDPGVGSQRRILAARSQGHIFLAPDNGILTGVLGDDAEIRCVTNSDWFRCRQISRTFHGRDIFAPVAAHLARGEAFDAVGERVTDPVRLDLPRPSRRPDGSFVGSVVHVDSFGNLITNFAVAELGDAVNSITAIDMLGCTLPPPSESYAAVGLGQTLTIIDSFDFLEIAVRGGSAAKHFNAGVGDEVRIRFAR